MDGANRIRLTQHWSSAMQRICSFILVGGTFVVALAMGCGKQSDSGGAKAPATTLIIPDAGPQKPGLVAPGVADVKNSMPSTTRGSADFPLPAPSQTDGDLEKYNAALGDAIDQLGQKKYAEALANLELAAKFKDTEFVQMQIKQIRLRLDRQDTAVKTAADIQVVIDQGDPTQAGQLAGDALREFGAGDAANALIKLKQQTDALLAVDVNPDAARRKAFLDDGDALLKANNLRAAALSLEQALQMGDDAGLRQQLDELRARLAKYDDNRERASELRKNSAGLEDAIALLQEAQKLWDTTDVRQDLDECNVALQNRRERLAVADFEVRGDIGIAGGGQLLAEELLPQFKGRYSLVERGQIATVLDGLKLEVAALGDEEQRQVGQVAKVRYLVLGSITRLDGLIANARLIDASSGAIVQTAKVTAATPQELLDQMPTLGKLLQMNDQEQQAYLQDLAQKAQPVAAIQADQPLPPAPEVPAVQAIEPTSVSFANVAQPDQGKIGADSFQQFQAPPASPAPLVYGGDAEIVWQRRAMLVSVDYGDILFRRGRFFHARQYYNLGLGLDTGFVDVQLRIGRCEPFCPPVDVIVVAPPPPRIAFVNFYVTGAPVIVPPYWSYWVPQQLAWYSTPQYQVVDPGELNWWMWRMGMTVQDLMYNPYARRWLGRALNIRYFAFGSIVQTGSFDVNTYLIDAENGYLAGRGFVHARTHRELRWRLGELAQMTFSPLSVWEQQRLAYPQYEVLIGKANDAYGRGEIDIAIGFLNDAGRLRPGSLEVRIYLDNYRAEARRRNWQAQNKSNYLALQAAGLEQKLRAQQLATAAEAQRVVALQQAAALGAQQQAVMERRRVAAFDALVTQARAARQKGELVVSVQRFDSALALRQQPDVFREKAAVQLQLEQATATRRQADARALELRAAQQKTQALLAAQTAIATERKQREVVVAANIKLKESRDGAEFDRLLTQGQKNLAEAKFAVAVSTLIAAQQLKKTAQVDALLAQASLGQAKAAAEAKGPAARQEFDRKLAQQEADKAKALADAKSKQDTYQALLGKAQKQLASKAYDGAIGEFEAAGKIFKTDAVLTGLAQAKAGSDKLKADQLAIQRKDADEKARLAQFQQLMNEGQAAFGGKNFSLAVEKYSAAKKLIPANVDVIAGLAAAEQARDRLAMEAKQKTTIPPVQPGLTDAQKLKAQFDVLMVAGQKAMNDKKFADAVKSFTEATKLMPTDKASQGLLQLALQQEKKAAETGDLALKQQRFKTLIDDARKAIQGKQLDAAAKTLDAAAAILPQDPQLAAVRQEIDLARRNLTQELNNAKSKAAYDLAIKQGNDALAGKKFAEAMKSFQYALEIVPNDPTALKLLQAVNQQSKVAKGPPPPTPAQTAEYNRQISLGLGYDKQKKWEDAMKAYDAALKQIPKDARAEELHKKASFNFYMSEGNRFFTARRFVDARREYDLAIRLFPNDPDAIAAVKKAKDAK
jgi:tetratricopeptide (TPR) repeat protein